MRIIWHKTSLIALLAIALCVCLVWLATVNQVFQATGSATSFANQDDLASREVIYSRRCLASLQQQKYIVALTNCSQAISNNPANIEARLNLGLTHFRLEQYQQAIAQYQFILQKNNDYRALYNWGLVNVAQGNYQQGIERYNLALAAPEITKAAQVLLFNDLGAAQIMLRQYKAAISSLDQAIELDKNSLASYFNRGCAHHHQGDYTEGIADFSRVIALDSNYTQAYISRAILHHLVRHEKSAYEDLDVVLQHYQAKGDRVAYQRIVDLRNSMVASRVQQTV
ncbi:MAG: tetratricopeptide repeat protein [Cyanobacteria bacterium J06631_2]